MDVFLLSFIGISAEMKEEIKEIVKVAVEPLTQALNGLAIEHNINNYDIWTETGRSEVEQKEGDSFFVPFSFLFPKCSLGFFGFFF